MAKKILTGILCCLMLFPVSVLILAGRGGTKESELVKAEKYFNSVPVSKEPHAKEDGTRFTIAYVDIDPYPASGEMLYYFIEELKNAGWIDYKENLPFHPEDVDAKKLIQYLAGQNLGDYIQFLEDASYYIAVDGKEKCRKSLQRQINDGKIDCVFCMGTSPAEMVVKEMQVKDVPVMVYFSVDPVAAGLSETDEYSGQDNVWCHTSSEVYSNQIQFYYENYPFRNIGMVYYNESVAAINEYRKAGRRMGFQIAERKINTLLDAKDRRQVKVYYERLSEAFSELVCKENIDAFLLNTDMIKDESRIEGLLEIFYQNNIPVFVQNGEYYVKDGAFMVVTASDAKIQAPFAVEAMAGIFSGQKPGEIYQKFVPSPYLSINLEAAGKLGYDVKEELLLSAEKLYGKTEEGIALKKRKGGPDGEENTK